MASGLPVLAVLALVIALMFVGWLATPKGPQQTCVITVSACRLEELILDALSNRLVRTGIILALTCCYLMWMVTYMAQLHPIIGECCPVVPTDESSDGSQHVNPSGSL